MRLRSAGCCLDTVITIIIPLDLSAASDTTDVIIECMENDSRHSGTE